MVRIRKLLESHYKRSKEICKTAGDHEAEPKCNRYYRDGKSSRGRRRRCSFSDQYADRNEDRYQQTEHLHWQIKPVECPVLL